MLSHVPYQEFFRGVEAQALDGRAVSRQAPYAAGAPDPPNVYSLRILSRIVAETSPQAARERRESGREGEGDVFTNISCKSISSSFEAVPKVVFFVSGTGWYNGSVWCMSVTAPST